MQYVSTRGEAPRLSFSQAMLTGLARDGGLYVPETYPALTRETIAGFAGRSYQDVAQQVIGLFGVASCELRTALGSAYQDFRHVAVTPLTQIGDNLFVLELAHGPTLAFKDVAMQLLGRLMDAELGKQGRRAAIVGATSGDTGAAAMEAFKKTQAEFHEASNTAKNASLYVDWVDGAFVPPAERITQEMLSEITARNAEFLGYAHNGMKMLQRLAVSPDGMSTLLSGFVEETEKLRAENPDNPIPAMEALLERFLEEGKRKLKGDKTRP